MKKFMEPRSVAFIGMSSRVGKGSLNLFENLLQIGFPGKIYPVNPKIQELLGRKVYPDISAVPEEIDLAVVMTSRQIVPGVLEQCARKGIDSVVIVTQGFGEADEEGKALQRSIDEMIKKTGVRVLGPNSIGVINHFSPFSTSFIPMRREESPIAFVSQSGGFIQGFSQFKIGKGIDLGNTCDVDFGDALNYLEDDPQIRIIGLYVEHIRDGAKFIEIAKRVAQKKLVLVFKAGKSEEGAKAAQSHSGSLAGEEMVYEAAFRQAGLIRVRNVEEFGDISKAFLSLPPVKGNRVGIITPTGAGGVVILDNFKDYGFKLATLSEDVIGKIKPLFLPWQKVSNPLDMMSSALAHGYKKVYKQALENFFNDDQVDVIICILGEPTLKTVEEVIRRYPTKPVVSWVIGQSPDFKSNERLAVNYPSPERGLRALSALLEHQVFPARKKEKQEVYAADRDRAEKILTEAKTKGQTSLGVGAFSVISAYGIPVAPFEVVNAKGEAVKAAKSLGYPVVIKIYSPEISHKSDVGGVRINIREARELEVHYEELITAVLRKAPNAKVEGVVVQRMMEEGKELILGAKRDPQFGPVIIFGWGGVYTELLKDFSCGVLPLTSEGVERMISSTKIGRLLDGFRGEPPSDRSFVRECILRLGQLVSEFPDIVELDINPLTVFSKGGAAIDARAIIA